VSYQEAVDKVNYIEEILLLNKHLSYNTLIYNKYSLKAKILFWLLLGLVILLAIIMLICIFPEPIAIYLLLLIPIFGLMIFASVHEHIATQKVIEKYYGYALKKKRKWSHKTILEIRKTELTRLLDNKDLLKKNNLIFLIETIKYHNESKHKFGFLWNAIIILVSVYLGGFLGGYVTYYDSIEEFLGHYGNLGIIIGAFIILAWAIDKTMIKDFIETKRASKNRLLRTLENIYINIYAT